MPDPLARLLADPRLYALLVVLGGVTWSFVRVYIERRITSSVDARFAQRLESHKHDLQMLTEAARFDFQRRLADIAHYSAKRHAAAAEVYAAMRVAHGLVLNLRGPSLELTYDEFNREDLAKQMKRYRVPLGKQEAILDKLDSDRPAAIKEMAQYLRVMQHQLADRKFQHARNLAYLNDLYFSDSVVEAINAFFAILAEWFSWIDVPPGPGEAGKRTSRKAVNDAFERVHELMRAELSFGEAPHPKVPAV